MIQPQRQDRRGARGSSQVLDPGEAVSILGGTLPETPRSSPGFDVHLDNFAGPFDLLLKLIA